MKKSIFALVLAAIACAGSRAETPVPQCLGELNPVGEARGIHPGRVAWSHAPGAVSCAEKDSVWWNSVDQQSSSRIMDTALLDLTGASNSGTTYTPGGDGKALTSLGVAEHSPNAWPRKYSRNLGPDEGIELIYTRLASPVK